uniref:Uncharacterized protein n=1 Tax=Anopheles quadriannulatus TaxID=34691 RepID=A0A182WYK1_ANOQN
MYSRQLTVCWMVAGVLLLFHGTTVQPVACESETSGGFFAHLWDSIFGSKQQPSPSNNSTAVKNETDSSPYNATTLSTTISSSNTTSVSTESPVENGANDTTTTATVSTSAPTSSSDKITTESDKTGHIHLSDDSSEDFVHVDAIFRGCFYERTVPLFRKGVTYG